MENFTALDIKQKKFIYDFLKTAKLMGITSP
jgi:hypothetical protein